MSAPADAVRAVMANRAALERRIADAGGGEVQILAVTKGFGPEVMEIAAAAGCRHIGENYAQELLAKRDAIAAADIDEVRFIGHIQSNKVRQLAGVVDVYETVDRSSLLAELERRDPGARILVQVNATGEPTKAGCEPDAVADLVAEGRERGLRVEGLMTIGPTLGGPEAARPAFRLLRALVDDLGLVTCSMGMSDDLEIAVSEGSTQVRVGTALFGARPPRTR